MTGNTLELDINKSPNNIGDYNLVAVGNAKNVSRIFYAISSGYEISAHNELEILLVLNGNLRVETEGVIYNLLPMDMVVINSNKVHVLDNEGESEIVVLQIVKSYVDKILDKSEYSFKNYYPKNSNFELKIELINALIDKYDNNGKNDRAYEYLEKIISLLEFEEDYGHEKVSFKDSREIVYNVVERLSYNINLSLDQLAKEYHISYSHLSREFNSVIGIHFTDYVKKTKLNTAIHRLINTNKTITDISMEAGFANSQLFSRNFREEFDMTPSQFRKLHKGKGFCSSLDTIQTKLKTALLKINQQRLNSQEETLEYSLDSKTLEFSKYKRTWGKVVDLEQFVFGQFQIDEFLEIIERYKPEFIRINFKMFDNKFLPVINGQDSKSMTKVVLDKLFSSLDNLGVNIIFRLHIDSSYKSSNGFYVIALNSFMDYISIKMGLNFLEKSTFEFYNSLEIIDFNYTFLVNSLLTQAKSRVSNNLRWGMHLGNFDHLSTMVEILESDEFLKISIEPTFLSLNLNFNEDNKEAKGLKELDYINYPFLIDFVYYVDEIKMRCNPIVEALHCIKIIENMQSVNLNFHLISWEVKDMKTEHRIKTFNAMGIETVQYYFMYFMSMMNKNTTFIEPGLIMSKDENENYNALIFSYDDYQDYSCIGSQSAHKKVPHFLELMNTKGKYKVIEKRIPLCSFSEYYEWMHNLEGDVLSTNEICHIRKKLFPELKINILNADDYLHYDVNLNALDMVFIKLQKI